MSAVLCHIIWMLYIHVVEVLFCHCRLDVIHTCSRGIVLSLQVSKVLQPIIFLWKGIWYT